MALPGSELAVEIVSASTYTNQVDLQRAAPDLTDEFQSLMDNMGKAIRTTEAEWTDTTRFKASNETQLERDGYEQLKDSFYTPAEAEQGAAAQDGKAEVHDMVNKVLYEMQLSTMNQLIFGITTRLGSNVNQLMRGQ